MKLIKNTILPLLLFALLLILSAFVLLPPTRVKADTASNAHYITNGNYSVGDETLAGYKHNFTLVFSSPENNNPITTIPNGYTLNWKSLTITIIVNDIKEHVSFTLVRNGVVYTNSQLSGKENLTLFSNDLPNGNYTLTYVGKYKPNLFTTKTYTYHYSFNVDNTAPSFTLSSAGKFYPSNSFVNNEITYTISDTNPNYIFYQGPLQDSYLYTKNSSFSVSPTLANNGWWYFYAEDAFGNVTPKSKVYLDTVVPTGLVKNALHEIVDNNAHTNMRIRYFATDSGCGISKCEVKTPDSSNWIEYEQGSPVGTIEGWYEFRSIDRSSNISNTYAVYFDNSNPIGTLFVDGKEVENNSYTNGLNIAFICEETCYVKLPDNDSFCSYVSGTEFFKAGKYIFYAIDTAGNSSGEFSVVIDRTNKIVILNNVKNGITTTDVSISWSDSDPNSYAPIKTVTVNGLPYNKDEIIYTINTGIYDVKVVDAAGNIWETSFRSQKQNVFTKTLQKAYYETHDSNNTTYSFSSLDSAFAFALNRELSLVTTELWSSSIWDVGIAMDSIDSINAKKGTFYIYKKESDKNTNIAYFTRDRLTEVASGYAQNSISMYYYWEKDPAAAYTNENLYSFSDNKTILAKAVAIDTTVGSLLNNEVFVGETIDLAGRSVLTIYDNYGNTCDYLLLITRETPLINYSLVEGSINTASNDRTYYFKDAISLSISDELDPFAMFQVYDNNQEMIGAFSLGEVFNLKESGIYSVKSINHFGFSEPFNFVLSLSSPQIDFTVNPTNSVLEIHITESENSFSKMETLDIYASYDNGLTWIPQIVDDYDQAISNTNYFYNFRTSAIYKVIITDIFRSGIDAVTKQFNYISQIPTCKLYGVTNYGSTNTPVSLEWNGEAATLLEKDGFVLNYSSGESIINDGSYTFKFDCGDGYELTYHFVIDTIAPKITLDGVANGGITTKGVTLLNPTEEMQLKVFLNDIEISYAFEETLLEKGSYRILLTDKAGNATEYSFEIISTWNASGVLLVFLGICGIAVIVLAIIKIRSGNKFKKSKS